MRTFQKTIEIRAPAARVFEYLADFTRHPEWATNPLTIEQTTPGAVGLGTKFASVAQVGGERRDEVVITQWEPNRRIAFESRGDAGLVRNSFTLEERGGVTTLTKASDYLEPSRLSRRLAPVLRVANPLRHAKNLKRIKNRLETNAL